MFGNKAAAQKLIEEVFVHNEAKNYLDNLVEAGHTPDLWELEQKKAHLIFIHDDMMMMQPHHDMIVEGSVLPDLAVKEAVVRIKQSVLPEVHTEVRPNRYYPLNYGYTTKKFTFVKKDLSEKSFPIALHLRDTDNLPKYMTKEERIRGEIYAIRPQTFIALDNHRQNGVQFERVKVNINIGYRKLVKHTITDSKGVSYSEHALTREEMCTQEMFMYVGREEYWKDQLESGFFDFKPVDIVEEDRLWLQKYYQYSRVR